MNIVGFQVLERESELLDFDDDGDSIDMEVDNTTNKKKGLKSKCRLPFVVRFEFIMFV